MIEEELGMRVYNEREREGRKDLKERGGLKVNGVGER